MENFDKLINDILMKINYDSSKTLTENRIILAEQVKKPSTVEEVKKFQDWLDKTYGNWLKGGKLNSNEKRGWGKFGPYTRRMWNQSSVRTAYGKFLSRPALPKTEVMPRDSREKNIPVPPPTQKGGQKQTVAPKQQTYKYSPRIDAELAFIKSRNSGVYQYLFGKPFIIYDPKYNLLYLFDSNFELVKYTQVVDGADPQKEKNLTSDELCKAVNMSSTPHVCTDKTGKESLPYYKIKELKDRFLAKGIYSIARLGSNSGYSGKGTNLWALKDSSGVEVDAAIHGIPNSEPRLTASKELANILQAQKNAGRVPQEYLNAVNTAIASANQSYGCIGVPAEFIDDPKVVATVKAGIPVYVMGEGDSNYLVQNSENFFKQLGGSGESCKNPEAIASSIGTEIGKSSNVA